MAKKQKTAKPTEVVLSLEDQIKVAQIQVGKECKVGDRSGVIQGYGVERSKSRVYYKVLFEDGLLAFYPPTNKGLKIIG